MPKPTGASIRARVRAELTEEIKTVAREHLAADGANLSLRAVARDLGMVSSALYRYFASRDDLLTALIIDAYDALGAAAEEADRAHPRRGDFAGRWLAVARTVREWGLARPAEYALIYGSPVPGYVAPADTTAPATRTPLVLCGIVAEAEAAGALTEGAAVPLPAKVRADLRRAAGFVERDLGEAALSRAMIAWTQLFGAVSFELFGQLQGVVERRAEWFDHQTRMMITVVGLA